MVMMTIKLRETKICITPIAQRQRLFRFGLFAELPIVTFTP